MLEWKEKIKEKEKSQYQCFQYLSDPGYQQGIGQKLGVSQAMVS